MRNSRASSFDSGWSWIPTNSVKEGTEFNLSLKYVGRLLEAGGSGFAASVAKDREVEEAEMKALDT